MLKEHYVTIWDQREEKEKYLDVVWDILQFSYAKIGGVQGTTKEELLNPEIMWKMVRRNNKIVSVVMYKTTGGRKVVLAGSDGTPEGKKGLYDTLAEDIKLQDRNTWAEVSGAMEHIYINKLGGIPIPNDKAEKVLKQLGKEINKLEDGYHYTRIIGDSEHTKIMVGNLPAKYSNL